MDYINQAMGLEAVERNHDSLVTNLANFSGSNEKHQINHDLNENLIKGAEMALYARELGIEDIDMARLLTARREAPGTLSMDHGAVSSKPPVVDPDSSLKRRVGGLNKLIHQEARQRRY